MSITVRFVLLACVVVYFSQARDILAQTQMDEAKGDERGLVIGTFDSRAVATAYMRSDNPILGSELKSSYRNPKADRVTSAPRTNRHGQRDVERKLEKPAGVRRVILLGDSVVESSEVPDIEKVMSRRLEQMFPDNTLEVLNFGVNGYCTLAEVELLHEFLLGGVPFRQCIGCQLLTMCHAAITWVCFPDQATHFRSA